MYSGDYRRNWNKISFLTVIHIANLDVKQITKAETRQPKFRASLQFFK